MQILYIVFHPSILGEILLMIDICHSKMLFKRAYSEYVLWVLLLTTRLIQPNFGNYDAGMLCQKWNKIRWIRVSNQNSRLPMVSLQKLTHNVNSIWQSFMVIFFGTWINYQFSRTTRWIWNMFQPFNTDSWTCILASYNARRAAAINQLRINAKAGSLIYFYLNIDSYLLCWMLLKWKYHIIKVIHTHILPQDGWNPSM